MGSRLRSSLFILLAIIVLFFASIIASHSQSVSYYYDDLNRLVRIDYGYMVIDYTYDDVGNRLTESMAYPPVTAASPGGGVYGSAQSVTLACTDPQGPGCGNIYYTTDGTTPTTSSPIYSSAILISSGTTLKFFAIDVSNPPVNETGKTQIYTIDTEPPTGTIIIQGGAETTASPYVTLTLTCADNVGCSQMRFSNDDITYSTPEAYGTTRAWTLTAWDGAKTVYAKFKDTVGNWSNPFLDTIALNNDPPNPPIKIGDSNYMTLQAAYNAASDGSTIKCQAITLIESLTVNRNINVTLEGGYDSGYTTNYGNTTSIKGMITTTAGGGTITIENFVLGQ